jgi:hypothetical protein
MNIKSRINKLKNSMQGKGGDYCQCYELAIENFPERISNDWQKRIVCGECRKIVDKERVKEIFDCYQSAEKRIVKTYQSFKARQI